MSNYNPNSNKKTNGVPMYSQGKHTGDVIGHEWRKNIVTAWMLNKPPALAVDVKTLQDAVNAGAEWLVIHNTDSGITYRISIETILQKGWEFNRGYGFQRGCILRHFQQSRGGEIIHEPTAPADPTALDVHNVTELKYKSHAPTGITFNGIKQMKLFEVK